MQEADFRRWMEGQDYAGSTVQTYGYVLRRLEERFGDLDHLWDADRLQGAIGRIDQQRQGHETGDDAYRDLSGDITRLNAYARFRSETVN